MMDQVRAGVYCRISEDRDGHAAGVGRQEADCRALCARLGWEVHEVYVDNDVSAYRGKARPGYARMLDDLKAVTIGAVAVWHPDRLTRRPLELEGLIDLIDATGAKVASVSAGEYDLATASGKMIARILGATARAESERMGERIRRAGEERARQGLHNGGGPRPFGYAADRMTVLDDEAELLRSMLARFLAGETLRSITLWGRSQPVRPVRGGEWQANIIRQTLRSPRIAGLRQHRGEVLGPAAWPAIVDRGAWEAARALMDDPARRQGRRARRWLLTGVLRCGACGQGLYGRERITYGADQVEMASRYFCLPPPRGCNGCTIGQSAVEADVIGQLVARLDRPVTVAKLRRPVELGTMSDVGALEAQLVDLAGMWAAGSLQRSEWLAARSGVEERLSSARRALVGRERALTGFTPGSLRNEWDGLVFDIQRAIVEATIDRIEVGPAVRGRNRYDPARIRPVLGEIVWRA